MHLIKLQKLAADFFIVTNSNTNMHAWDLYSKEPPADVTVVCS